MAADGYGIPHGREDFLGAMNDVCTVIFILEAVVKISAFTFANYVADRWNVFDLIIVLISICDLMVGLFFISSLTNPMLLRILRMIRVMRVLRTLRIVKSARGASAGAEPEAHGLGWLPRTRPSIL